MKTLTNRLVSIIFAMVILLTSLPIVAFAEDVHEIQGLWHGDKLAVDIVAGEDGYTYMSLFRKPVAHGYEFSGHFMGDGEGPQTFVLIDTVAHDGTTWKPDGRYVSGLSNYEVVYCCDVETIIQDATYYKRLNLEDSEYYDATQATKLRAIVTNSYPYVSLSEMKSQLKKNGFEGADDLKVGEVIAAVQTAIWACANGEVLRYCKSYRVTDNLQWGEPLHDVSDLAGLDVSGKRVFKTYEEVGKRIDSLVDYLLALESVHSDVGNTVVSSLEILDSNPVFTKEGVYTVLLKVELNHSGREGDDLAIDITVDGKELASEKVVSGVNEYIFAVEAKPGEVIKATLSGEQLLNKGVYFYAPRPQDVNGDGIATSREVSQNLIGVAAGMTPVHCEKEIEIPEIEGISTSLKLRKVDADGKPLSGAEFTLYTKGENGLLKIGAYSVDAKGELLVEDILPGSYVLEETKVPFGYLDPNGPIEFTVDENGYISVTEGDYVEVEDGDSYEVVVEKDVDVAENEDVPFLELEIIPGETTEAHIFEKFGDDSDFVIIVRDASGTATEIETTVSGTHGALTSVMPEKNLDNADDLEGGYWDDPESVVVTGTAPEGYSYQLAGAGQQSYNYISRIYVVYEDEKDENGQYVIKELRKVTSKVDQLLTVDGVPTTDIGADFDQATGTTAAQAFLKDAAGNTVYVYCLDLGMPTPDGSWYSLNNLEDVDYFASEEAEKHIRNIVTNGYWGTASGNGSLAQLKEKLVAALKNGEIDTQVEITYKNKDGKNVAETVTLTEEILNGLTSGEAMDMTQAAIWAYSNGCLGVQDGRDGYLVGNVTYGNSNRGTKHKNHGDDVAGMARMSALYNWLINLNEEKSSTAVLNEYTFADNMVLNIKNKVADAQNDVYLADLGFELDYTPNAQDDLLIHLSYTDANGDPVVVTRRLAGENTEGKTYEYVAIKDGRYVIENIELPENMNTNFTVRVDGVQNLENGVYIFLAHDGIDKVQTLVGIAEGTHIADITKSFSFSFEVEESKHYEKTYTKTEQTLIVTNNPETVVISGEKTWNDADNQDGIRPESITVNLLANGNKVASLEVTEADGWKYTFENIPKYENGKEIIYTISEVSVDGYTTVYDGYTIVNTHTPETVEVSGEKTWNDADNQDGIRPESITIKLYAGATEIDSIEVTEADGWRYSFENLPKYENGKEIVYSVSEVSVDGYTTVYDGYNVINTHVAGTEVTLSGIKYLDGDEAEGFEFILADENGKVLETVKSGADGRFGFAAIAYSAEGVYKYSVKEVAGSDELIDYDESEYTVTVTITKAGESLEAAVEISKDQEVYEGEIEFYNETLVEIPDELPPLGDVPEISPETGDNTNAAVIAIVCTLIVFSITLTVKRSKND
ncbi:MAG: Cna B-type domain-containing protein [Ruminococcaceae bacterium]|nr:Cna B-type domain-containing protein [Oscillospiraceae bacterium]